jgi:hypothetical protein
MLAITVTLKIREKEKEKALAYDIYNIYKAAYIIDESPS